MLLAETRMLHGLGHVEMRHLRIGEDLGRSC